MFARSGRAQLAYDVVGRTGGVDALLLHAGVTDRRSWRPLVERLRDRHRCVTFDRRGYGETTYEHEDGWSPVADAVAVLDHAGIERAVLVGSSIGGQAALDLALAHPDRVAGLVLIGPAVTGAPAPGELDEATAALDAAVDAADAAGDQDEVNRLEAWFWLDGPHAPEGRVPDPARALFLEMNGRALRAQDPGEEAEPPAAWPRLGAIAVPTLVLVGELDLAHFQARAEHVAASIPNARLQRLAGVAHVPQVEADEATLSAVAAFLAV